MVYVRILLVCTILWGGAMMVLATGLSQPKDMTFTATVDGSAQHYVLMLPDPFDATVEHHLLIALHGHGSDRWQYVRDARGECQGARDVAAKYGMIYVSPDYRARTSWMGPKAEADMVQLIGDLRKAYRVGKIFLAGGSMGGSSVLTFAALHPELIAGVSSQNGMANHLTYEQFQDAIAESFGGHKADIPEEYKKRSAEYWPERFTMPVAITVGGKDTLVPPDSVLRLAAVLQKLKRKVLVINREDGGHMTNCADTTTALEFVVEAALGQAVPKKE